MIASAQGQVTQVKVRIGGNRNLMLVKPLKFLILGHAQTDHHIQHLEEDPRDDEHIHDIGQGSDALCHELASVTVEQAGHRTFDTVPAIAILAIGKQSQCQYTPGAVGTVH